MVEQLLRLKLRLLGNAFRRSPWRIVGLALGLASGIGLAIFVMTLLIAARLAPTAVAVS